MRAGQRTCVVVSIVPVGGLEGKGRAGEVIAAIRGVQLPELDLCWHDIVHREASELVIEEDPDDESDLDRSAARILAVCSVASGAFLAVGEKGILTAVSGCRCNETPIAKACEVWLTAPCLVPLFLGTPDDLNFSNTAQGITAMKEFGMTMMANALDQPTVCSLLAAADTRISAAEQAVATKRSDLQLGKDLFAFAEFSSRGGQRFDLLFTEDDPSSAAVFHVARSGPWIPMIHALLGPDCGCMASVVYSRPGAEAQDWHTDGAHIGRVAGWSPDDASAEEPSPAYAVCVFVALIPLDREVGFTQFWPRTHRHAGLVGFGAVAPLMGCAVDGLLGAGGCAVYDYRLMHRGMANRSAATQRPLLQLLYHVPSYAETKNYGAERLFG